MKITGSVFFAAAFFFPGTALLAQANADITLPDILAVELPPGVTMMGPDQSPLREFLASAHSGSRAMTSDLRRKIGPGALRVTWSAWAGKPGAGKPVATRTERIFILPAGMTPVGTTKSESATAGNNAAHIVRDSTGRVHMIWKDSGAEHDGPVYRRASIGANGMVRFETPPLHVADEGPGDWNAYPALAAMGETVQLVWQGGGTLRTRKVTSGVMGPVMDTRIKSEGRDIGPAIVLDAKGGAHVLTPGGLYGFSSDGGQSWKTDTVPLPPNTSIKTQSLTVDPGGTVHIAFSAPVTRIGKQGDYWQLRTISRKPDGSWVDATDVLARAPGWAEPSDGGDIVADWARIAADNQGGLHLTWHGTVLSHKFAHDTSFYAWRKPGAGWQAPVALITPDAAHGIKFSYAPSLALDGDRALALTFYEVDLPPGTNGYDSVLAIMRGGRREKPLVPVTQFVRAAVTAKQPDAAIGSRFPAAAPTVWRTPDKHIWLDVLELLQSPADPKGTNIVVYQRLDLTAYLGRP